MARDPKAEIEVSAHSRGLGAKLREARAKFSSFGGELKRNVFGKDLAGAKGFFGKAGASMLGNIGAGAAGAAVSFLSDQAKGAYEYADSMKRLQIAAEKTPAQMKAFSDEVRRASDEVGINKGDVLAAAKTYVALTGDMDGAAASTRTWVRVAQAGDATVNDIATSAQAMRDNLKIKPGEMELAFGTLIKQGKMGAIEMKDLAGGLSQVTPLMAQFGKGTGVGGLATLGATMQVVRKGFGSADETVTGTQSLFTALIKNAKLFGKAGIKIFDKDAAGNKTLKTLPEIINAISDSKLMKDPTKLEKAFGRVEAYRAFLQLNDNKQLWSDLINKTQDASIVQKDLDSYMQSTAGKTKQAWTQAKNSIAEAFTPERIESFTKAAVTLGTALVTIAGAGASVLSTAEYAGKKAAQLVGGKSWDDQVEDIRTGRREERLEQIGKAYDQKQGRGRVFKTLDDFKAYKEERRNAGIQQLGSEDAQLGMLGGGQFGSKYQPRIGAPVPRFDKKGEFLGVTNDATIAPAREKSDGNTVEGLMRLRDRTKGSGASNEALMLSAINREFERIGKEQVEAMNKLAAAILKNPTEVKVGADSVANAKRKAPQHARRPGV